MTTIYKLEGKPFIYSSEKPFPEKGELEKYPIGRFTKKYLVDSWFSQATKTPVKEGEENNFLMYLYWDKNFGEYEVKEGVELDPSCFKIEKKCIGIGCPSSSVSSHLLVEKCEGCDRVAVFVPPVGDHANEKTTHKQYEIHLTKNKVAYLNLPINMNGEDIDILLEYLALS